MEANSVNVANRLFWVLIVVREGKYPSDKVKEHFKWVLPWHVRNKWDWYFKYRAALAQVQNPKFLVQYTWGSQEPDTRTRIDFIKKDITTKKRMITKISNELERHKKFLLENSIFGLADDDGRIPKAEGKIANYQKELQALMVELSDMEKKNE